MIALETIKAITKVVVHKNCPDGTMSAAIIRQALPRVSVEEHNYNTPQLREVKAEPGLCVCDFSPPPGRADEFLAAGAIVLDHHAGCADVVRRFVDANLGAYGDESKDPGVSGAVLAYQAIYLPVVGHDAALNHLATLVGIRDTWQKNHPLWELSCEASSGLRAFPFDYWLMNRPVLNDTLRVLGKASVEGRQRQVREALSQLEFFTSGKTRFAVFSDPKSLTSDLAELVRQRDMADVLVGFFYVRDKAGDPLKLVFSCRSGIGQFDVSSLCRHFGGGGHTRAAGFGVVVMDPMEAKSPFRILKDYADTYTEITSTP